MPLALASEGANRVGMEKITFLRPRGEREDTDEKWLFLKLSG